MSAVLSSDPIGKRRGEIPHRACVVDGVIRSRLIQRGFGWVRLLLRCERTCKPKPHDADMYSIEPGLTETVDFVGEAAIRYEDIIPFVREHTENVNNEIDPVILALLPDNIRAYILKYVSALCILLAVPAKEGSADVLQKVSVVYGQDTIPVCFQQILEDSCCCILSVLRFT